MKKFHVSDILCVITGNMVSIRGMEGLYDILNYMSGDNLHTHQLPRVMDECKPYLIKQFPQLESVDVSMVNEDNFLSVIDEIENKHGRYFEVEKLPDGAHKKINPIAELIIMTREEE